MRSTDIGRMLFISPLDRCVDRWRHGSRKRPTAVIVVQARQFQAANWQGIMTMIADSSTFPNRLNKGYLSSEPRLNSLLTSFMFAAIRIDYVYWHETWVSLRVRDWSSHPFCRNTNCAPPFWVADRNLNTSSGSRSDSLVRHVPL